jgi:hypothetical protein
MDGLAATMYPWLARNSHMTEFSKAADPKLGA